MKKLNIFIGLGCVFLCFFAFAERMSKGKRMVKSEDGKCHTIISHCEQEAFVPLTTEDEKARNIGRGSRGCIEIKKGCEDFEIVKSYCDASSFSAEVSSPGQVFECSANLVSTGDCLAKKNEGGENFEAHSVFCKKKIIQYSTLLDCISGRGESSSAISVIGRGTTMVKSNNLLPTSYGHPYSSVKVDGSDVSCVEINGKFHRSFSHTSEKWDLGCTCKFIFDEKKYN